MEFKLIINLLTLNRDIKFLLVSLQHKYASQFSKYLDSFYAICIPQTVFTINLLGNDNI